MAASAGRLQGLFDVQRAWAGHDDECWTVSQTFLESPENHRATTSGQFRATAIVRFNNRRRSDSEKVEVLKVACPDRAAAKNECFHVLVLRSR
jgi:hypothetical protein